MLTHYIKISYRNLMKHKLQTAACIIGLALGLTCFSMSALWMRNIASFDNFHKNAERTYMVSRGIDIHDNVQYWQDPIYRDYLAKYPEVENVCGVVCNGLSETHKKCFVRYKDTQKYGIRQNIIDSAFCSVFDLEAVEGRIKPLKNNEAIITDALARTLFGNETAVGKVIEFTPYGYKKTEYKITAVVKEWKQNSLLTFDILTPGVSQHEVVFVFVKTHKNMDYKKFEDKIYEDKVKFGDDRDNNILPSTITLCPINRVLIETTITGFDIKYGYIRYFVALGIIIILCAVCSYLVFLVTNLHIRSREMALRRVLGSSVKGIIGMVAVETLSIFAVAAALGVLLTIACLPYFREYSNIQIPLTDILFETACYIAAISAIATITAATTTLIVLRTSQHTIMQGHRSRQGSSVVDKVGSGIQLTVTLATVVCSLVMLWQVRYMSHSTDFGIDRHNLLYASTNNKPEIMQYVKQSPLIEQYLEGNKFIVPVFGDMWLTIVKEALLPDTKTDADKQISISLHILSKKEGELYHITPVEGRFSENPQEIVINESLKKNLGLGDKTLGSKIHLPINNNKECYTIVGVIKDIYRQSPITHNMSVIYIHGYEAFSMSMSFCNGVLMRIKEGHFDEVKHDIEKIVGIDNDGNTQAADAGPQLIDVEEEFCNNIKSEMLMSQLLSIATAACIIINIIGLLSIISLSLEQRTKEIALRKIHGATRRNILSLFLSSHIKILTISSIVAFPVSYMIMRRWIESYPLHITISWWLFPLVFVGMLFLIIASVFWQIWKAARQNPAEVLKSE